MKVDLNDVIECIEFEGELLTHYYNKNTEVIIYVEDASTATYKAEDINSIDTYEEWEKELIMSLNDFKQNPEAYIQLPTKDEIDEHGMMIEFCKNINDEEVRKKVLGNKESFRALRESIENSGLSSEWYYYREKAERKIAIKWCEDNSIEY
ncbi:UPF0158 family protein [Clostridioides difficile]